MREDRLNWSRKMVDLASCHDTTPKKVKNSGKGTHLTVALAGNANVGKSVIFNQLTGSQQTIGNWPGKTVERAEGVLHFNDYDATIVDLPGIYSMSTFSLEEIVSREYIATEKPDVIINVVGAAVLERNLFFTLQLMEMGVPMVLCLNQMDVAKGQGIVIDAKKLESLLGIPVVPTVAAKGKGIRELIETAIKAAECKTAAGPVKFSEGIETDVEMLTGLVETAKLDTTYPARWLAVKLLEGDTRVKETLGDTAGLVMQTAAATAVKLEESNRQPAYAVMASARYALAADIAREAQRQEIIKPTMSDRLDGIATHHVYGYFISFAVIAGLLLWTFLVGNSLSILLTKAFSFFSRVDPQVSGTLVSILWNGVFGGFVAGVTLVVPYVVPFYLMLAALEDSGILTRVAFMTDSAMHKIGLHGKAIIPIILGYGCNVPAIYSTRIMSSRRERLLTAFAITFAPCPARVVVILGLVAAFLGIWWALGIYMVNLIVMFGMVKLASKTLPGDLTGMIMEMHSFNVPSLSVMVKQTWARTKSLIYMVFPIYMISSAAVQAAYALGWLNPVNQVLSPITVGLLGLPVIAGTFLLFGAARKELVLLMAIAVFGANLALHLTSSQLVVLALVATIYPCMATIGVLTKEFGWKAAWSIIGASFGVTFLVGGVASKILTLVLK
jgi:ferrous iron transport protein B